MASMKFLLPLFFICFTVCMADVQVFFNVKYDVSPVKDSYVYGKLQVAFIDLHANDEYIVREGNTIKPGRYKLKISHPGYKTLTQIVDIPSHKYVYKVVGMLTAEKRHLSSSVFMLGHGGCIRDADAILFNGVEVNFEDTFAVGVEYRFIVKIRGIKTFSQTVIMEPGVDLYAIKCDLKIEQIYQRYKLRLLKKYHNPTYDGIQYPLKIAIDGEQLEQRHVTPGDGFILMNYEFYAPRRFQKICFSVGYYYDEVNLTDGRFELYDLSKIDPLRLMAHIKKVQEKNPVMAEQVIDRLLSNPEDTSKLSALSQEERQMIIDFVEKIPTTKSKK